MWIDDDGYPECNGRPSGCEGCEYCVQTASTVTFRFARKALPCGAMAGDLVARTKGFTYQKSGPRLEYLRPKAQIAWYGPQWGNAYVGIVEIRGFKMKPEEKWPHLADMMKWRDRLMTQSPEKKYYQSALDFTRLIDQWAADVDEYELAHGTWCYKTTTRQVILDAAYTIRQRRVDEQIAKENTMLELKIARECEVGTEFTVYGRRYKKTGFMYYGPSRSSWSTREVDMATIVMKIPVIDLQSNQAFVLDL